MNKPLQKTAFQATLIYDEGDGGCREEHRVYHATHPEIAYQRALAHGKERRAPRRFVGLSHLEGTDVEVEPYELFQEGDANELVVRKEQLAAFSDPRWKTVACDEDELAHALREPPLVVKLEGLENVPWHEYLHAYGNAADFPIELPRMASADPDVRSQAHWVVAGATCHQGTIYPATAAALPFLIRLAGDRRTPDRNKIWALLGEIAESSAIDPGEIRKAWAWRRKNFGEIYASPIDEMAASEVETRERIFAIFLENIAAIRQAAEEPDVRSEVESVLGHLERGPRAS
jgi:hypothetical protein